MTAHFVYERLEKHCSCCNRLDHDIHDCLEAKARKREAQKAKEAEENPYRLKDAKEKEDKARATDPRLTLSTTGERFDSRRSYDSDYHRNRRDREEHGRTTRHHPYRRSERGSSGERRSQYLPTQRQMQPYHKTQDRHSRERGYRADSRDPHWEQPHPSDHIDKHIRNYGYEPRRSRNDDAANGTDRSKTKLSSSVGGALPSVLQNSVPQEAMDKAMGELRDIIIQYTSCADPTESAARKKRM